MSLDTSRKAKYKNERNSKTFLLAGDKFMPEMHLKQPGFTYSGPFTKNQKRIQKFKETGDTWDTGDFIQKTIFGCWFSWYAITEPI